MTKCVKCGEETGAVWKELCINCFKEKNTKLKNEVKKPVSKPLEPQFYGMLLNNAVRITIEQKPVNFIKSLNENFNRLEEFALEKWKQRGLIE